MRKHFVRWKTTVVRLVLTKWTPAQPFFRWKTTVVRLVLTKWTPAQPLFPLENNCGAFSINKVDTCATVFSVGKPLWCVLY